MLDNAKINMRQFFILVFLVTIGDLVLILPSTTAAEAMQDAWICSVFGLAIGLLIVLLLCAVAKRYPHLTLFEMFNQAFGKWIGTITSLLFLCYFVIQLSAYTREIGNFMTLHMLEETPIHVIQILFLSIIVMAVRLGLEAFTRVSELFYLWFVIMIVLFVAFVLPQINMEFYQPVLEKGIKPVLRGSLTAALLPFSELIVFLMILPQITEPNKIRRPFIIGATLGGLVIIVITYLCILVLGSNLMARNVYPAYSLARKINIGEVLQRVEAIFTSLWLVTTFIKMTLFFYALNTGIAKILNLKEYRSLTFPGILIISIMAMIIAPNTTYFHNIVSRYWAFFDLTYGVALPLLVLAAYALRKKLKLWMHKGG